MISVENVCKIYSTRFGPRTILDNVNFRLERGRNIGILGHSSGEKSASLYGLQLTSTRTLSHPLQVTRNFFSP